MTDSSSQFLQGTVDMLVLKALQSEPRHGYGVARWVRETTDERIEIEEGALYTALHRMKDRGWIESEWGVSENNRRAKFYQLTEAGRNELARSAKSWRAYAEAVLRVLEAGASAASGRPLSGESSGTGPGPSTLPSGSPA